MTQEEQTEYSNKIHPHITGHSAVFFSFSFGTSVVRQLSANERVIKANIACSKFTKNVSISSARTGYTGYLEIRWDFAVEIYHYDRHTKQMKIVWDTLRSRTLLSGMRLREISHASVPKSAVA